MLITRHAEAVAVLSDTRYVPPPVRQDAPAGTLSWLRAQVSRFSTGEVHAERRRLVAERLATLDPAALRQAATAATLERGGDWPDVPTAVLGAALGITDEKRLVGAVTAAAAGYLSGEEGPEADAAVADLVELLSGEGDPIPRITILLQAHAATAGLIANALTHADPGDDVDGLLRETLRHDPPLKASRRLDRQTGDEVTIDLVAANRDPAVFPQPERFDVSRGPAPHLTFGSGVRPCPASAHALALAAGVLTAVLRPEDAR
ncbi:cytochrome P450 [Nonomuraea sp. NEAU-A123]|uniref:cytochrome P450 n=1 Tax=Nonomuraea sp. NEAU-A123 TaxID=2839649 RepID=UPI001BE49B0C|nr:cytochrome P450 [Nonomuraea sp. NEAU-A123]MBT2235216.1 cytochrome P450 [Nonomuraea sp. NEAU-A123]